MGVNVSVGVTHGFDDTCFGFLALVRLERDAIVVEATTVAQSCSAPMLAHLDRELVVVEPLPPSNTGESAAVVDGAYRVLHPRAGQLVFAGVAPAFRSWGNGASGTFVSFTSRLVAPEGPTLTFEELWRSEVLREDPPDRHTRTHAMRRAYSLEHGALAASPRGWPRF
jgi:hypothetical protein